jgi:integrase
VIGTHVAPESPRERVLSIEELAAVWRLAGDDVRGAIIRLLVLTACRAAEVGELRLSEIRDDTIELPPERVKNARKHSIPLAGPAQSIIATIPRGQHGDYLFAHRGFRSWSHLKRGLDGRLAAAGVALDPWTIHDLRRSAATGMADLGTQPHVVEAVLNHISGHKAGVAGIYNKAVYEKEKCAALGIWADHVVAAAEGRGSNVVSIARMK